MSNQISRRKVLFSLVLSGLALAIAVGAFTHPAALLLGIPVASALAMGLLVKAWADRLRPTIADRSLRLIADSAMLLLAALLVVLVFYVLGFVIAIAVGGPL